MKPLHPAYAPITGVVSLPGDKSISHRAVLFSLLTAGVCRISGWLDCRDTRSSLAAVTALGATVEFQGGDLLITPPPAPPAGPEVITIDCGNSGTTARLLTGLLSGWLDPAGAMVRLVGDASLSRRPMARVVDPLRAMGADIAWEGDPGRLPLLIRGAGLEGNHHRLATPSAQVKSALQLAGLFARGENMIQGADGVRDHTDRLLDIIGPLAAGGKGQVGTRRGRAYTLAVPGDPSAAAFFQTAAALVPGSHLQVDGVSLNPGRTGFLAVLRRAGVRVEMEPAASSAAEPSGKVTVSHDRLRAFTIRADEVPALVDELPLLALLATQAEGRTTISGAADLRHKESDRIAAMAEALSCLGADITAGRDGWLINGPTPLRGGGPGRPAVIATAGDHRIAMSMAVAALIAEGGVALDDDRCVAVSFPDFFVTLNGLIN